MKKWKNDTTLFELVLLLENRWHFWQEFDWQRIFGSDSAKVPFP